MGKTKKRKCMNTVLDKLSDEDKKVIAEIMNNAKEIARNIIDSCTKIIKKSR